MNAYLRSDAVTGTLAPARVVFRVRQRTEQTFDVVRKMYGPDVLPVEEEFISELIRGEAAANDYAYHAAESFLQQYPNFTAEVLPWPRLGRRPEQAYAERADETRLGVRDCLEPRLPAVGSFW